MMHLINSFVECIVILEDTYLAKKLTVKLHAFSLKYSCRPG